MRVCPEHFQFIYCFGRLKNNNFVARLKMSHQIIVLIICQTQCGDKPISLLLNENDIASDFSKFRSTETRHILKCAT